MLSQDVIDTIGEQIRLLTALLTAIVLFGGPYVSIGVDVIRAAFPLPKGWPLVVNIILSTLVGLAILLILQFDDLFLAMGVYIFTVLGLAGWASGFHEIKKSVAKRVERRKATPAKRDTQPLEPQG